MSKTEKEKLGEFIKNWEFLGEKVLNELMNLPNFADSCKCRKPTNTVKFIYEGPHFDEIHVFCTKCGGFVE